MVFTEATTSGFYKKVVSKNFGIFTRRLSELESLFKLCQKETPTELFSCENWEIFRNTYYEEHLQTAASVISYFNDVYSI